MNLGGHQRGTHFVAYDGNGNVAALVSAANGSGAANYEYGPFGEVIRATGPMAKVNPFMFSTKFYDWETGLYYYGYRYYNPSTGRWLSRDPAGEDQGGPNLYGFVGNDSVNNSDPFGLWVINRNKNDNWAWAIAQLGDTVQSLATLIHLNASEANKWLKGWDGGQINSCSGYRIPNTVVVYTSKPTGSEKHWPSSWQIANAFRARAIDSGDLYEFFGYKVLYNLDQSSEDTFKDLWKTDGIFAYAFGGHGAEDNLGYVAAPGSGSAVGPKEVSPPYHLQAIGAYCCYSANDIIFVTSSGPNETGKWRDLISDQGTFVGFTGAVNWLNVWWNQDYVNNGLIPP